MNIEEPPDIRFVWIDCEVLPLTYLFIEGKMTGLEPGKDRIIEVAAIVTDEKLEPIDPEGFESVIHCPEELMNNMCEWCIAQHGKVCQRFINIF
jgi:oligoribonuclease (3'-5' exoribonuclease)